MPLNPEEEIVSQIESSLKKILAKMNLKGTATVQEISKRSSYGDYCTPIFPIAGKNKINPNELAKEIAGNFPKTKYLEEVNSEGGFVNYKLKREEVAKLTLQTILTEKGFFTSDIYKGKKIIVEHTSANPNGPIHIGNFRGSIIGDVYARILQTVGAEVSTNFYVDDLGHQIPVVVIGYELYRKKYPIPRDMKIDHLLGQIYGITHTIYDIQLLKKELEEKHSITFGKEKNWLKAENRKELADKLQESKINKKTQNDLLKRFDFIFKVQENIFERFKELYDKILLEINDQKIDLTKQVPELNREYMEENEEAVKKVRKTCEDSIRGQKEELALFGITHDHFDWEADLQWSGKVGEVLAKLETNGFVVKDGKARLFDANKAADLRGARSYLNLKKSYEIPKAILITSKGDTLYLLRDIAYSLKKVDKYNSDLVFNVIGKQQELTQLQLNLAVRAIGRDDVANKMWHLNYEYMELKGAITSMSARRLQYITPLQIYEATKAAVLENFLKERNYSKEEKDKIAHIVTVGAIKYSIIAVGLMKKLIYHPQEVISLTNNTSPFIQYAYARSQNILEKTDFVWEKSDQAVLEHLLEDEEWILLSLFRKFPQIIENSAEQIKPELICSYLFDVATAFNKFYDSHRVLDAETKELVQARLALTYATGKILSKGLNLLGIDSPKKM